MQRSATAAAHGTGLQLPADLLVPGPDVLPAVIPLGSSPGRVAAIIAAHLALGDRPATAVFGELLHREIRLDPIGPHVRPPRGDEVKALRLRDDDEELYVREGLLVAGTVVCAKVSLRLAFQRVCQLTSGSVWGEIRSGTPAGVALGPHGLLPGRRRTEVIPDGNPCVTTWRVSMIRTMPVCITTEEIGENLCQRLAGAAAAMM